MEPTEAHSQLGTAQFVDVRLDYEWEAGHIEGAVHIPLQELPGRFVELDKGRAIIAVCQVGQRSALAAEFLRAQGYDAHNLEGGVDSWTQESLPLVSDVGPSGNVVDGTAETLEW